MQYTSDYIGKVAEKMKAAPDNFLAKYRVDVDMKTPPMLEMMRAMDMAAAGDGDLSVDSKDRLLHHSIIGREVKISYDGVQIGSFISNSLNDPWDNFEVLVENPTALRLLYDLALSSAMEKWLPPRVSTPPVAAATSASRK